jgi:sugar phosphate isomerase/epimerase
MRTGIVVPISRQDYTGQISHAVSLGFKSGQISVWDMSLYNKADAEKIKELSKELNFEITAVWCGWSGPVDWSYPGMYETLGLVPDWLRAQRVSDLLKGAEFSGLLGVKTIVTHTGYVPDSPFDPVRRSIVKTLKYLCTELEKENQVFTFETGEELPITLVQMILEIGKDNVGVNFDPANLTSGGRANSVDALSILMPYVKAVHAKDAVFPSVASPKGKQTVIGKGAVDFRKIIQMLHSSGYNGDLSIERETPEGPERDRDIIESKTYLDAIINEVCSGK